MGAFINQGVQYQCVSQEYNTAKHSMLSLEHGHTTNNDILAWRWLYFSKSATDCQILELLFNSKLDEVGVAFKYLLKTNYYKWGPRIGAQIVRKRSASVCSYPMAYENIQQLIHIYKTYLQGNGQMPGKRGSEMQRRTTYLIVLRFHMLLLSPN